jgi:glycosyltransferase involved in cell wall biosynthesis
MRKVKIVSVNYKTPDLIYNQYNSVRKFYPEIKYEIIDGSDDGKKYFVDLEKKDPNFVVRRFGYNIHHGPGMDYAIKNSSEEFLLILDSDISLKSPLIEPMIEDFTGISKGLKIMINKDGVSLLQSNRTENQNFSYPYIHPYCMLIDRNKYISFKPFKKHGAPCIDFMMDVYEKGQSDQLIHFDINDYVNLVIRGTRSKWGINL